MNHYEFTTQDMSCQHCINAVTKAIHAVDDQAQVKIDLTLQKIWVDTNITSADITQAIQNAGYTPIQKS